MTYSDCLDNLGDDGWRAAATRGGTVVSSALSAIPVFHPPGKLPDQRPNP